MRNRFIVALLTLVAIFAFAQLSWGQDPEGPDSLYISCGTNVYPGSGTTVATFQLRFFSDNASDLIAGIEAPIKITASSGVSIDTSIASAFTGSPFDVQTKAVAKFGNPDPTVQPYLMNYGWANISGSPPYFNGDLLFVNIKITVNDTGTVCFSDTLAPTTGLPPNFVTAQGVGYNVNFTDKCCDVTPYVNQNPVVACGGDREAFAGATFSHAVLANDPDAQAGICANIVSSTFQFLDANFVPVGPPDTAPCGTATLTGPLGTPSVSQTFNWTTTGCPGGDYYVVFTYTDECGGSGADTCKYTIKTACAFVTIGEVIADPCEAVEVPVTLNAAGADIGGFNFCIEFANADLTVISVRRGELINAVDQTGKFVWHYFTFRLNPSTVIHKYKVCVIGIGRLYSSYPGMCITQGTEGVLFYIKFVLACNELFRCHDTHVTFEWDSWTCLENTLSDCTGNKLFVSDDTLKYNRTECGLGTAKQEIVPCVNFQNGRVIWRCAYDVDPIIIGDVNVNGVPYEIADAVLFASYFIEGEGVFSSDPETRMAQEGGTDINQDGYLLSVADLVYMLRILVGDQAPLGAAVTPGSASVDFNGRLMHLNTTEALGAIVFTFKGEGSIISMNDKLTVRFNSGKGETKVIVYTMSKGVKIESGDLFSVRGNLELVNAEAATYGAQPINVEMVGGLPKTYTLSQNYPNPFNATTQINFALPQAGEVTLKIYNVAGQLVKSFNQHMEAGYRTITWDGTNSKGETVASGVYFYRLDVANQFSKTLKMTLLK